jgi:ABC-2 type transport system permease protein
MPVFKAALRVFLQHRIYIVIYIVWLSFMGVFVSSPWAQSTQTEYVEDQPSIAIIDRDDSTFSQGFVEFLSEHGTVVDVEDSQKALQDATAQNQAAYIVIIPAGFGDDFVQAAEDDTASPVLDTVVSYESVNGSMMDNLTDEYLNTARIYAQTGTETSQSDIVEATSTDMREGAGATLVQLSDMTAVPKNYLTFMQFSSYTSMLSILVLVAVVMGAFNKSEVRKRNFSSPVKNFSMTLQVAAACMVIALITWAWVSVLGLVVFHSSLAGVSLGTLGLTAAALLALCMVGLAIGTLIGQLTTNELIMNSVGNIVCLTLSFLGGVWIPLSLVGEPVVTIARFTPTYYYGDALTTIADLQSFSPSALTPVLVDFGMMLLFAATVLSVALVAGKVRRQSGGGADTRRAHTASLPEA